MTSSMPFLAAQYGAGLYTSGGMTTLNNVSLTTNVARNDGAAIFAAAPVMLTNVTLANNTAGRQGRRAVRESPLWHRVAHAHYRDGQQCGGRRRRVSYGRRGL